MEKRLEPKFQLLMVHFLQFFCKDKIQDELKFYLRVLIDNAYTNKAEVLSVHVNKEIYQANDYRQLGGINLKTGAEYIKNLPAWDASNTFTYHGFNLDNNDTTKYECVLTALFNTYGIKQQNYIKIS